MSAPGQPPWSPFPVQDWSQLPAGPPTEPARPVRRGRGWLPIAVITALGLVVAGSAYAASSRAATPSVAAAHRFLPADGAASYARVETTRELKTTTNVEVTESARLSGYTALLSTDTTLGVKALGPVYDQGATIRLWRTISTVLDDPVTAAPATPQTTRVYRINDGIELLGESRPDGGYAYQPGLVELPADVAAGHSWTSAGSAGDTLDYRSEFRAEPGTDDCLQVSGQIRYTTKQGQQNRVVGLDRTWCPGLGITAASQSFGDIAVRSVLTAPLDRPEPATADIPIRWSDPQAWTASTGGTRSGNPAFGEGPMSGTSLTSVTPVRTQSGLIIQAMAAPTDLIATTVKDPQTWTTTWRAHPGGNIMSMAAFGNVVVVTTSERRMVGYSDQGVRLWQLDLDELAPTAPVRVSDTEAVLVDLSGDVRRFDLVTGTQDWQRNVGSDVNVSPAVAEGLVVVADRSATVTGLDLATGEQRWTQQLDAKAVAVVGDTVVVVQDQTAHGLSVSSGQHRWLRPYDGTLSGLTPLSDRFLLATSTRSVLIDKAGAIQATLGGYLDLTVTPELVVGWGKNRAELINPAGQVLSSWQIPPATVVSELRPGVAKPDGVMLFNLDWTWGAWTRG